MRRCADFAPVRGRPRARKTVMKILMVDDNPIALDLLEHTLAVAKAAKALLPLYPRLNADLVLTGVFLHDIGKIEELAAGTSIQYTDRGQLVGHIVLAGGLPNAAAIARIKDSGAKLLCFASALAIAKKLVRMGADALVIEGMEAGGHIGPVSTGVLAQEILPQFDEVPVFVAGGIGRGAAIAAYLEMGAAGVQLGTRFVCAHESVAHPRFKQAFLRAGARDAVPSVQLDPRFSVIPVRAIANDGTQIFLELQRAVIDRFNRGEISREDAQLEIERFWAGALRSAVIDGDVERGSLMAGQSVGLVTHEQSTQAILDELVAEAVAALSTRSRFALAEPPPLGEAGQ